MFRKSILGIVALATLSLVGALAPPAEAVSNETTQQLTPTSAVIPLTGDFNGDGAADILWYGPRTAADSLWFNTVMSAGGNHLSTFTVTPVSISGNYTPAVGDYNGDGRDDIFWYQAGTGADSVWFFNADKSFTSVAQAVDGNYRPVVGNFDPNPPTEGGVTLPERDDIFWYPLTRGNSSLSTGNANKTFTTQTFGARAPAEGRTLVGEFEQSLGGVPTADILFYVPGTVKDSMWISDGTGNFTRTELNITGDFRPIVGDFTQYGIRQELPAELVDGYGTPGNEALDAMVDGCWAASMLACDDLHRYTDANLDGEGAYHDYAERCGGRRSPGIPNCVSTVTIFPRGTGLTDILWHGVGAKPDKQWVNNGEGFDITTITIGGNALATVVPGSANGPTGGDRIIWNDLDGDDTVWVPDWSPENQTLTFDASGIADRASGQRALAADFAAYSTTAQYLQNEVLWFAPGNLVDQKETIDLLPGGSWS